ncbi:hypothetical protein HDU97_003907 [Phlyctochytrium planicorne]|nr:hypothetical protein HDU97_003907 [Phlyctochytrium planicorne]
MDNPINHRRASSFDAYDDILEKVVTKVNQSMSSTKNPALKSINNRILSRNIDEADDDEDDEDDDKELEDEFSWEVSVSPFPSIIPDSFLGILNINADQDDETLDPSRPSTSISATKLTSLPSSQRVSPIPFRIKLDEAPAPLLPEPVRNRTTTEILADRPTTEEHERLFNEELRKAKILVDLHERVFQRHGSDPAIEAAGAVGGGEERSKVDAGEEEEDEEFTEDTILKSHHSLLLSTAATAISSSLTPEGLEKRGQVLAKAMEALSVHSSSFMSTSAPFVKTIDEIDNEQAVMPTVQEMEKMEEKIVGLNERDEYKVSKQSRGFERFIPTGVPTFRFGGRDEDDE